MSNILIVYSTRDGQTLKICQTLQTEIETACHQVTLTPLDAGDAIDFSQFDKIVIGASIHYGFHDDRIHALVKRNQTLLNSKPSAFFSVNIVARKPGKNTPETNPYLLKFLKKIAWKPKLLAVFAGKLDYPSYSVFDRWMIRFIMWLTKGPTNPEAVIEFTDWQQVQVFAQQVIKM